MVKEREMKRLLVPVEEAFPNWVYHRGLLFQLPIGYYLRGVAFDRSWSNPNVTKVLHCVYPLFESTGGLHISWGGSHAIPGTPDHGWNVTSPYFVSKMIELMKDVIIPATSNITKGVDFFRYLTEQRCSSGWPGWGKALAYIHMGELELARELLSKDADVIRTRFPMLEVPGTWGENLLRLLELIETNPDALPAHCEATAQKAVKANKLEKYWEPVPFTYDKSR
jgi:hypothetical protein